MLTLFLFYLVFILLILFVVSGSSLLITCKILKHKKTQLNKTFGIVSSIYLITPFFVITELTLFKYFDFSDIGILTVSILFLIASIATQVFIIKTFLELNALPAICAWLLYFFSFLILGWGSLYLPKHILFQPFSMLSGSMEDTIQNGDYLISSNFTYGYSFFHRTNRFLELKNPERRDLITFLYPNDSSKVYIKRCVAIPGDVVEIKNKTLYINQQEQKENYIKHIDQKIFEKDSDGGRRDNVGPATLQSGQYYVLGDNRDNSMDSRYFGPVEERLIIGKAEAIYWRGDEKRLTWKKIQ